VENTTICGPRPEKPPGEAIYREEVSLVQQVTWKSNKEAESSVRQSGRGIHFTWEKSAHSFTVLLKLSLSGPGRLFSIKEPGLRDKKWSEQAIFCL
jgi:hypothetical protein